MRRDQTAAQTVKAAVALLCVYELAAITTGRVPTVTAVCQARPWLKVILLSSLGVHLYRREVAR